MAYWKGDLLASLLASEADLPDATLNLFRLTASMPDLLRLQFLIKIHLCSLESSTVIGYPSNF